MKCPGYRPAQSFILHQFNEEGERPQLIKEDEERYRYAYRTPPTTNSSQNNAAGTLVVQHEKKPAEPHVPKQVSSIAVDRIQHLGTFIQLYLPRADGTALPPPSALMLALPTMPVNSQVLLAAIDALSAAQLAVNDRNYALVNRSRSMYGTALSQMLKAIQDPVLALKDETLLSTYMLTLYEVIAHLFLSQMQILTSSFRFSLVSPRDTASSTTYKACYTLSDNVGQLPSAPG